MKAKFATEFKAWQGMRRNERNKELTKIKARKSRERNKQKKLNIASEEKIEKHTVKKVDIKEDDILKKFLTSKTIKIDDLVRSLNTEHKQITPLIENMIADKKIKIYNGSSLKLI